MTDNKTLDLINYPFPKLDAASIAFSTLSTDPKLLAEAERRGFARFDATPYNKLFNTLFYSGGKLNYKKDLDEAFANRAIPYLKAFMSSFEPKHEHKEFISAMLLSELVEISS